jgi:peptidyl-prolyl cis-trans isomerase C
MRSIMSIRPSLLVGILIHATLLAACSQFALPSPAFSQVPPSPTLAPPTPTPVPLAAVVNGQPIRLVDYLQEIARFEAAQITSGTELATLEEYQGQVLEALIERLLLAQGAQANGIVVDQDTLNTRVEELASDLGGNEAFSAWLSEVGYSLEDFRSALAEEILAAAMVDQIAAAVPETAEQVHARHILTGTRDEAEWLRGQLTAGNDFAILAGLYSLDPSTSLSGGDLGWFPRGYLLTVEVEEVAFSLQPGEIGEIVESPLGFHIVQSIERAEMTLEPDAMLKAREQAVKTWLASQREAAKIEILIAQ